MKLVRSLSLTLAITAVGAPTWTAQDASKAMSGKSSPDMALPAAPAK